VSDTVIDNSLCPKCGGLIVQMYYSLSVDGEQTVNFECVNSHEWNGCNPEIIQPEGSGDDSVVAEDVDAMQRRLTYENLREVFG